MYNHGLLFTYTIVIYISTNKVSLIAIKALAIQFCSIILLTEVATITRVSSNFQCIAIAKVLGAT